MITLNTSRFIKAFIVLCAIISVSLYSTHATAQAKQYKRSKSKKSNKSKKGDKVDVSGVADKYWAPKDTDFSVVQNRTYSKEKKVMVSASLGPVINDEWSSGQNLALSANYFFNERHGIEVMYMNSSSLEDSDELRKVKNIGGASGVAPDYGRIKSHYQVSYNWVPFYAKMSLLDKKIIYFDMVISPGIGFTDYDQFYQPSVSSFEKVSKRKSSVSYTLDITQFYFISKKWAVRADLRNRWYDEEVLKYQAGSADSGQKLRSDFNNRTIFTMGVMYSF